MDLLFRKIKRDNSEDWKQLLFRFKEIDFNEHGFFQRLLSQVERLIVAFGELNGAGAEAILEKKVKGTTRECE